MQKCITKRGYIVRCYMPDKQKCLYMVKGVDNNQNVVYYYSYSRRHSTVYDSPPNINDIKKHLKKHYNSHILYVVKCFHKVLYTDDRKYTISISLTKPDKNDFLINL